MSSFIEVADSHWGCRCPRSLIPPQRLTTSGTQEVDAGGHQRRPTGSGSQGKPISMQRAPDLGGDRFSPIRSPTSELCCSPIRGPIQTGTRRAPVREAERAGRSRCALTSPALRPYPRSVGRGLAPAGSVSRWLPQSSPFKSRSSGTGVPADQGWLRSPGEAPQVPALVRSSQPANKASDTLLGEDVLRWGGKTSRPVGTCSNLCRRQSDELLFS
jgi:hypothetical protein